MVIRTFGGSIEEINFSLSGMKTELNKIAYLESVLRSGLGPEEKRFVLDKLGDLYSDRGMYEKAAKTMYVKAGGDVLIRDKIESYLKAGELYARAGKIEDAEDMFLRAIREANSEQKAKIKLARKNIFIVSAKELELKGKKVGAAKYYEKLLELELNELEKKDIKEKLISVYKSLGKFRDIDLLEGIWRFDKKETTP